MAGFLVVRSASAMRSSVRRPADVRHDDDQSPGRHANTLTSVSSMGISSGMSSPATASSRILQAATCTSAAYTIVTALLSFILELRTLFIYKSMSASLRKTRKEDYRLLSTSTM